MRPVGNALELKLCKIPTIGTQSENQTLPTGNISLGSPIFFSGWALHPHRNLCLLHRPQHQQHAQWRVFEILFILPHQV
ncbi:hypothetical protein F7210_03250 [Helicobacter pylori]|nr:hypothetical protein [Helicobacter pylori]